MATEAGGLRQVAKWVAIIGLIGNHVLAYQQAVDRIRAPSRALADMAGAIGQIFGQSPDRFKAGDLSLGDKIDLFVNPYTSVRDMAHWEGLNHLLFWPGLAALILFLTLTFGGKRA
ncbi:hypothetical protein [Nitrospirillum sp. BR 11163]|uniref:hypothetical protein n=1 Tax=Nitrospirillum sp. BR 11163 TaxID=3104323 RepID=UPI002B002431|nr:hypothetical protein [Nitrospirillum sp. BR 11163]MEA1675233.1 hypothetical protein [Nitrospirillum sp. BR 11163]